MGASYFFNKGSPCRILFWWYFLGLKNPAQYGYEFEGWEDVDGRPCMHVKLGLSPPAPGADRAKLFYHHFWIDMDRGGNVLRYEHRRDKDLRSRVDGIELRQFPGRDGKLLWVPIKGEYAAFSNGKDFFEMPLFRETYSVVQGSVRVNRGVPDKELNVDWNWANPAEPEELRRARERKLTLSTTAPNLSDSSSVKKRLDEALAAADSQSERLDASSAGSGYNWSSLLQVVPLALGVSLLAAAAAYKVRHAR